MTEPTLQNEEYAALHKEATSCMAELALLERSCVVGATVVFAWVATNAEVLVGFAGLVWLLPVGIAAYGSLKALAIRRHIAVLGGYLKELERQTAGADQWQKHFGRRWRARRWLSGAAWLLFLGLTVVGSTLGFVQFRSECPGPMMNACSQDESDDSQDQDQNQESLKQGTTLRTSATAPGTSVYPLTRTSAKTADISTTTIPVARASRLANKRRIGTS